MYPKHNLTKEMAPLTHSSPRVDVAALPFDVTLKPHQAAVVRRALDIEEAGEYGIMSDPPGSGKTFSLLTLVYLGPRAGTTLVVVPHNIFTQWKNNIERFVGPHLKWRVFANYADVSALYFDPTVLVQYDVLLTTSLYYNFVATTLESNHIPVYRVIFDEADAISDLMVKKLPSVKTWFVSASIKRALKETGGVLGRYAVEGDVERMTCACDPGFIREAMCFEESVIEHVHKLRDVYLDGVLSPGGGGVGVGVGVLTRQEMTPLYANSFRMPFLGNAKAASPRDYVAKLFGALHDRIDSLNKEMVRINVAIACETPQQPFYDDSDDSSDSYEDPHSSDSSSQSDSYEETSSYTDVGVNERVLHLRDMLDGVVREKERCEKRAERLYLNAAKFDVDLFCEVDAKSHREPYESKSGKLVELICGIMRCDPMAKVLVFTEYYDAIGGLYVCDGIPRKQIVELDGGSVERVDDVIKKFRSAVSGMVMVMDSTVFGVGLDLHMVTHVVFVHRTHELVEKQVMGRALRLGRDPGLPLHVHRLVYETE